MGLFDEQTGGLITHWKTVAGITTLVGTGTSAKIWPHRPNQGTIPPYICFFRSDGGPIINLSGESGALRAVLHVYCYGTTFSQADSLARIVRTTTAAMRGTYSGNIVYRVECESIDDGWEPRQAGSDQIDFWSRLVIRIVHGE